MRTSSGLSRGKLFTGELCGRQAAFRSSRATSPVLGRRGQSGDCHAGSVLHSPGFLAGGRIWRRPQFTTATVVAAFLAYATGAAVLQLGVATICPGVKVGFDAARAIAAVSGGHGQARGGPCRSDCRHWNSRHCQLLPLVPSPPREVGHVGGGGGGGTPGGHAVRCGGARGLPRCRGPLRAGAAASPRAAGAAVPGRGTGAMPAAAAGPGAGGGGCGGGGAPVGGPQRRPARVAAGAQPPVARVPGDRVRSAASARLRPPPLGTSAPAPALRHQAGLGTSAAAAAVVAAAMPSPFSQLPMLRGVPMRGTI
mmetsp:Transcript_15536/g.46906  ORF Transcript_15536/g.46906 Transcript_15536/m.46906 type:complete len:310 (-) Transcript_15536:1033-1962(-)